MSALAVSGLASCAAIGSARRDGLRTLDAATFGSERRFARTRFGRIAYVERGRGPVALFFHGWPLNGFQWRGALERLSGSRRCIALDFMGLGYTNATVHQDLSPRAQAEMVLSFMEALAVPTIDVVASNSGGTIAQLLVAQHPERVRSLLFTTCDVHENSPPRELLPTIEAARRGELATLFVERALNDKEYARRAMGAFYTDPQNLTDTCVGVYLSPLVSSQRRIDQFHAYTTGFLPNPLPAIEGMLKRCPVPVRIVWGTGTPSFDVKWAYWLDQTLPRSRGVRVVEGAKLFFPEEMPDLIREEAIGLWNGSAL